MKKNIIYLTIIFIIIIIFTLFYKGLYKANTYIPNELNNKNLVQFSSKDLFSEVETNFSDLISNNVTLIDALEKLDFVKSRSEAKRLIQSNGIKVNDKVYTKENHSLYTEHTSDQKNNTMIAEIKITVGKKKIGLIKVTHRYKLQS